MSLETVRRQLARLSYVEMKALGGQIHSEISKKDYRVPPSVEELCDVLSQLPGMTSQELEAEEVFFEDLFRRKLSIIVQPLPEHWEVRMANGYGPTIRAETLRAAMLEFLDALAAYVALERN